jgi:hypothetical protein
MTFVLVGGGLAMAIGATLLYLAFRSFGTKKGNVIIAVLVTFVFACCAGLFVLSYR